jgi:hypothetical protein
MVALDPIIFKCFEVVFMWRVKPQGVGVGREVDSQIRGKGEGYIPKMLGPRILGTSTPHLGFTHHKVALPTIKAPSKSCHEPKHM